MREIVERRRQLQAAAAHIRRLAGDFDLARSVDGVARLDGFLPVDQHLARHDERLRLLAGLGQTALDQQTIEPLLHDLRCTMRSASSRSRRARVAEDRERLVRAPRARAPPCAAIPRGRTPRET